MTIYMYIYIYYIQWHVVNDFTFKNITYGPCFTSPGQDSAIFVMTRMGLLQRSLLVVSTSLSITTIILKLTTQAYQLELKALVHNAVGIIGM